MSDLDQQGPDGARRDRGPDFQRLFEAVPGPYLILAQDTPSFTIVAVNDAYLRATFTEREAIVGRGLFEVFPDNPNDPNATGVSNLRASLETVLQTHAPHIMAVQKYDIPKRDGSTGFEERYWTPVNVPVFSTTGALTYIIHHVEDVTESVHLTQQHAAEHEMLHTLRTRAEWLESEILQRTQAEADRKRTEEQLLQLQKMEAIGQLAGGIAHDFNNLLTVIRSYSALILKDPLARDFHRDEVQEIVSAADSAAALTGQLLAFSRKQVLQPQPVDLNVVVRHTEKMLRRLIGEDIELVANLDAHLTRIHADPGQLEQVLVNLVINARDAMPDGGRLLLETANVELSAEDEQRHIGAEAGWYVMLAVTDTGAGMSREMLTRIFDPFFTTKEQGKGTGLGLSTVYGIVKQSGGDIWVYSEPDLGTTFKIYLPRLMEHASACDQTPAAAVPVGGTETVLLVEDDPALRRLAERILRSYGYSVLVARTGVEALAAVAEYDDPIHLVATDVIMPGMNGRAVVEHVSQRRPGIRVLFMSGYTDDEVVRRGIMDRRTAYLQKPFTPVQLAGKVREILDAPIIQTP